MRRGMGGGGLSALRSPGRWLQAFLLGLGFYTLDILCQHAPPPRLFLSLASPPPHLLLDMFDSLSATFPVPFPPGKPPPLSSHSQCQAQWRLYMA